MEICWFSMLHFTSIFLTFSWTDQQRAQAAREGWGYRLVFSARLVIIFLVKWCTVWPPINSYIGETNIVLFWPQVGVFLAADALFIGAQQVGRYIQAIRSHWN